MHVKMSTTKSRGQPAQGVHQQPKTQARPLYIAYGSNLSATQMRQRCTHAPDYSATPLALARLDGWKWIISNRGYANVIPPAKYRFGRMEQQWGHSTEDSVVYGILYDLSPKDEFLLDGYEGVDQQATASQGQVSRSMRPREQGRGDYAKWYVPATVEKWFMEVDGPATATVLLYVDEESVREGAPNAEYIPRMYRGIEEATALGLPVTWTDTVIRKFIPTT
jgi:hypothetical protein